MLDHGQVQVNHRENRSCQRWGALPCRETGKVAGIQGAEGRFSRAAGLKWRSFEFRIADRGGERNSSLSICQNAVNASDSYIWMYMNILVINGSGLRRWRIRENNVPPWSTRMKTG